MAFNDAKRFADKLRIKNLGMFDQGDPTARREQCWSPWCDKFVEDMDAGNRCRTHECDTKLRQEAIRRGTMFRVGNVWFGNVDSLLVSPDTIPQSIHTREILKRRGLDDVKIPMCACGRNPKAPRRNVCSRCYQAQNLALHYERRAKRHAAQKGYTPGFNRIDGLAELKSKLK